VTYALYTRESPELQEVYSRGIPEDVKGEVRVVSIGGIDQNTCCGTHVRDTGDLQLVKILFSEKFKANTKIWFVAGGRVGKVLGAAVGLERQLQVKLQAPPGEFLGRVGEVQGKLKTAAQANKELLQELGTMEGREARGRIREEGLHVLCHHRSDGIPEYTTAFLVALSGQELVKKGKQPALDLPCAVFLSTGEEGGKEGGHLFLAGEEGLVGQAEGRLVELLQAKGRANKGEYRGKAGSLENLRKAQEEIKNIFTKN
jgi:misacylated tRNA(Ala) deacylase